MLFRTMRSLVFTFLLIALTAASVKADFVATGFFSGTIEHFDSTTGQQSTLAMVASADDQFPGLAGIVHDPIGGILYASARISNRVYRVDATSGAVLGFTQLDAGSSPAGLALDGAGNLYVANNGGNTISIFDTGGSQSGSISLPTSALGDNLPNGLAFDQQGRLVISTFAGAGLFRFDPTDSSVSSLSSVPVANGQVAISGLGEIFVGGAAFSNDVLKFAEDGTPIDAPFLTIDDTLLPQPDLGYASPDFTSPSGVTIDADGNLIVSALGRTNPTAAGDNFQSNGGMWKFAPDGTLLQTFGTNLTPFSSVTSLTAVPEPGSMALISVIGLSALARRRKRLETTRNI